MKKILFLFLGLYFNLALAVPHLEIVNSHLFEFVHMGLVPQLVPLKDGGYIVQKYGHVLSLFDAKGNLVKEVDHGLVSDLYQKGTQLKDGRIVFINTSSVVTFYDTQLNVLSDHQLSADYIWAPCQTDNGKLVFGTNNETAIVIMDNSGNVSEVGNLGEQIRITFCLDNNRSMVMSKDGILTVVDVSSDKAKVIFQNTYNFIDRTFKVKDGKGYFLTKEGMTIFDPQSFEETSWPNNKIEQFVGVDYFKDGRYAAVNTLVNNEGNYYSKVVLFSKQGEILGSTIQKDTGGTINSPVNVVNDRYILTNHCSEHLVLYDTVDQLTEVSRLTFEGFFCSDVVALGPDNFVFEGGSYRAKVVYQVRLGQ